MSNTTPQFTDRTGHDWQVIITLGLAERIRDQLEIDLLRWSPEKLVAIGEDPYTLGALLWLLCEKQAGQMDPPLSPEEFAERFDGDSLDTASVAFMEALINFSRRPQQAPLRKLLEMSQKTVETIDEAFAQAADQMAAGETTPNPQTAQTTHQGTPGSDSKTPPPSSASPTGGT